MSLSSSNELNLMQIEIKLLREKLARECELHDKDGHALLKAEHENRIFRRLLACSYSGMTLYKDDGELQDNLMLPAIDFKRMSADEIEEAMLMRAKKALQL